MAQCSPMTRDCGIGQPRKGTFPSLQKVLFHSIALKSEARTRASLCVCLYFSILTGLGSIPHLNRTCWPSLSLLPNLWTRWHWEWSGKILHLVCPRVSLRVSSNSNWRLNFAGWILSSELWSMSSMFLIKLTWVKNGLGDENLISGRVCWFLQLSKKVLL